MTTKRKGGAMTEAYTIRHKVTKDVFTGENLDGEVYFDDNYPYLGSFQALVDILKNLKDPELEYSIWLKNEEGYLTDEQAKEYISHLGIVNINWEVS